VRLIAEGLDHPAIAHNGSDGAPAQRSLSIDDIRAARTRHVSILPHAALHATHGATFVVFCEVVFGIWIVLGLKPASLHDDHCWPGVAKPRGDVGRRGVACHWRKAVKLVR
jgi:hypothetical protein